MYIDPCTDPLNATLDKRTLYSARQVMRAKGKKKNRKKICTGERKRTEESLPRRIGTGSLCGNRYE